MPKTAKLSDFSKQREIAAGGEGKIYEHPSDKNKVVKIYHKARSAGFVKHLELLSTLGPIFIKPHEIYVDSTGRCLGFDMQYVDFNKYWLFNNLFNKGFCNSNNITKDLKLKVLAKLKSALEHIHQSSIVVGDLNQYNLFFNAYGDILFVDVDSYQTRDNKHSGVLLDDIRDWTTLDINKNTDSWAYDILAFWSTTYCHPFKWVALGNKESLELRVKTGKSILHKIKDLKIPPLYEPPIDSVLRQFVDIFSGRRYMVNMDGLHVPVSTVIKHTITSNSLNIRELYKNITQINVCNGYIAIMINNKEWLLVEAKMKGITREKALVECEELFPSLDKYAYRKGNTLYSEVSGVYEKTFGQPTFDYNNGSLNVVDYSNDTQFSYYLLNQMGGIDCTQTPVFAKSIIKRSGNLQNFGVQKAINVPFKNVSIVIYLPNGSKDAFFVNNYIGAEYRKKNQVKYAIIKPDINIKNHQFLEFDYLPYFAVTNTNHLFIPDDGFIDVYKDMQFVTRFDCSMCTKSSRLYNTDAGILMLEDKILYLLNTK